MSALFVKPLPFTVVSANENSLALASNANNDEPALVWRSNNLTSINVIIDLGTGTLNYDTVAIIGSNLRSTDTVQIRTGATNTGIGGYAGTALNAYSGTKPEGYSTKAIYQMSVASTGRYMRLDFVATSHPDGYVEAQRIVVGKAITTLGVDYDAEQSFVDDSIIDTGPGWTSVIERQIRPQWKIALSGVSRASWFTDWNSFHGTVGKRRPFLFVPDASDTSNYQAMALFGRITADAGGVVAGYDYITSKLQITGLAP